jgi:hypothetical protein
MNKAGLGAIGAIVVAVTSYWLTDGFDTIAVALGLKDPPPSASMTPPEDNTDRPGNDYKDMAVASFEDCQQVCLADEKCEVVTFNKTANQCWLKTGEPTRVVNPAFMSSVKHMR